MEEKLYYEGEPLNCQVVENILKTRNTDGLEPEITFYLTNGFRRPYVELLISKKDTVQEQLEFLEKLIADYKTKEHGIRNNGELPSPKYYQYFGELKLQLKVFQQKITPNPAVLIAAHLKYAGAGIVSGVIGDWAICGAPPFAYPMNWVTEWELSVNPLAWKGEIENLLSKVWSTDSVLTDLDRLIDKHKPELLIGEEEEEVLQEIKSMFDNHIPSTVTDAWYESKRKEIADGLLVEFYNGAPSEVEILKKELENYKKAEKDWYGYFLELYKETMPSHEAINSLTAENAELKKRCLELQGKLQSKSAEHVIHVLNSSADNIQFVTANSANDSDSADAVDIDVLNKITPMFSNDRKSAELFLRNIKGQTTPDAVMDELKHWIEEGVFNKAYKGKGKNSLFSVLKDHKLFPWGATTWRNHIEAMT